MHRISLFILVTFALPAQSSSAAAQLRIHRAVGVNQTGPNDLCSAPIWTLGSLPAGPESSGHFLGLENGSVGATGAIPLTPSDCDPGSGTLNERVATHYDDAFGALRGWTAPDSSDLQFVSAVYMSSETFGTTPYEPFTTLAFVGVGSTPFLSTIPAGIVSFDQLGFRINAVGGPDPGPLSPAMCVAPAAAVASLSPAGFALLVLSLASGGCAVVGRSARGESRVQR